METMTPSPLLPLPAVSSRVELRVSANNNALSGCHSAVPQVQVLVKIQLVSLKILKIKEEYPMGFDDSHYSELWASRTSPDR